jgi:hypothetical protein
MNTGWPTFSFTAMLRPPEGWETDYAFLATYSADLVSVVTSLLALAGYELEGERPGSRIELVKTIEALAGRVRVVAQTGRVLIPHRSRPILKLLDKFVRTVAADENLSSWHPKAAFVRFQNRDDDTDTQWRVWLGSRNLTRALNWEAGLVLVSRSDGKGQSIDGLAAAGEVLAFQADITMAPAKSVRTELAKLTWECPQGSKVEWVRMFGPNLAAGLPKPLADPDRVFVISPFLDLTTVRDVATWGHAKTKRALVSTSIELQRLKNNNAAALNGFGDLKIQPLPDLPAECTDLRDDDNSSVFELAESEEMPPAGLHAKLLYAAKGARRQLWLGSANATMRGWRGRNFEIVAQLAIARDTVEALEEFIAKCDQFKPGTALSETDADEEALEEARKLLSVHWPLRQTFGENQLEILAQEPPPLPDSSIALEIAVLGGVWNGWPAGAERVLLMNFQEWQRSDFLQLRVLLGDRVCAWVQIVPCEPPPDDARDRGLIAEYLDPRTFLLWLRSVLNDDAAYAGGGDWDAESPASGAPSGATDHLASGLMPTIEEILRSWARDRSAFLSADLKVKHYLGELERRAEESEAAADAELLRKFQRTWETLALELR